MVAAAVAAVTDDADGGDVDDGAVDDAAGAAYGGADAVRDVLQALLHLPSYCNCLS